MKQSGQQNNGKDCDVERMGYVLAQREMSQIIPVELQLQLYHREHEKSWKKKHQDALQFEQKKENKERKQKTTRNLTRVHI